MILRPPRSTLFLYTTLFRSMYALDLATGVTLPGWPVAVTDRPKHEHVWTGLNLVGGTVYAGIASYCDRRPYQGRLVAVEDRKSTRLNSSHSSISYAVFCLQK